MTGIPLSDGQYLGNLGEWSGQFLALRLAALTRCRVDLAVCGWNRGRGVSLAPVREETGSGGKTVDNLTP